jgi:GNAT superfamily N-acetyltransferase
MTAPASTVLLTVADPGASSSALILRDYYDNIIGRYYGRAARPEEIAETLADEPSDDLVSPTGVFVVATLDGEIVGCGGVRFVDASAGLGEVTRVFVRDEARGHGIATALLSHLDDLARSAGLTTLRLTVRHDLVEARRLYSRMGFAEVAAFNTEPYADHWFAKSLTR